MRHICPVCGWDGLNKPAYDDDLASYEVCLCCNYQYGYDDFSEGITHEEWRKKWIKQGMLWGTRGRTPPLNWDPRKQLLRVVPASEIPD